MNKPPVVLVIAATAGLLAGRADEAKTVSAEQAPPLTNKEEATLRDAVYNGGMLTAMPKTGPWAMYDILVVPDSVISFKGAKTKAALSVLLDIVKGGRPTDALLAGGYAVTLAEDPMGGREVSGTSPAKFDEVIQTRGKTPRQLLAEQVQKLISR